MLDYKSKLSPINLFHSKALHVDNLDWFIGLGSTEKEQRSFDKINVLMSLFILFQVLTVSLNPWRVLAEFRLPSGLITLPNVGMKPLKIRVENRLVIFYKFQKVIEPHLLLPDIQPELLEQVSRIFPNQRCDVRPYHILFTLGLDLGLGLGQDALERLLLSVAILPHLKAIVRLVDPLPLLQFQ